MLKIKFVLIVFIILIICSYTYGEKGSIFLTQNWEYHYGDISPDQLENASWIQVSSTMNPPRRSGRNILWLKTRLPETQYDNPAIFLSIVMVYLEVYIDKEKIYDSHPYTDLEKWKMPYAHIISGIRNPEGKTIYFRIESPYSFIGIRIPPIYGDYPSMINHVFKGDIFFIIFAGFYIFIGFAIILLFLFQFRRLEYLFFGLFSLTMAFYTLFYSYIKEIIFPGGVWLTHCYIFCRFLSFIFFTLSFESLFGSGYKKSIRYTWIIGSVLSAIILILTYMKIIPIADILIPSSILLIITSLIIILNISFFAIRGRIEIILLSPGAITMASLIIISALSSLKMLPPTVILAPFGVFGLILSILSILIYRFQLTYKDLKTYTQEIQLSRLKLHSQVQNFLMVLSALIESKDEYTGGHVERVGKYARLIAEKLKMPDSLVNDIYLGAIVHDLGKISIKDYILNKPGKLDNAEILEIRKHPVTGKRLLDRISDISTASEIAYCHQERWDGTGYPRSLKGKEIPLFARIVTIADFWDSIITDRSYRKAINLKEAVKLMHSERGGAFDPDLFDIFMNEKDKLYLKFIDEEKLRELE